MSNKIHVVFSQLSDWFLPANSKNHKQDNFKEQKVVKSAIKLLHHIIDFDEILNRLNLKNRKKVLKGKIQYGNDGSIKCRSIIYFLY